jgi:hypothetical protein
VVLNRRDLQPDTTAELALAGDPAALATRVLGKLLYRPAPGLQAELVDTLGRMAVPALAANASNQTQVDNAKRNRVLAALLLTVASPEFAVQP